MEQSYDPINGDLNTSDRISAILKKCIDGEVLSEVELQTLDQWLTASPYNRSVNEEVVNSNILELEIKQMVAVNKKALWGRIKKALAAKCLSPVSFHFFVAGLAGMLQ